MEEESLEHIIWSCRFSARLWAWISGIFKLQPLYNLSFSYKSANGRSRIIKDPWLIANLVVRAELWNTRNKFVFEKKVADLEFLKKQVFHLIYEHSSRLRSYMHNTVADLELNFFRVSHRRVKVVEPIECFWTPPNSGELKLCCDGAARGNPGRAGAGVVVRDSNCLVSGAMSIGLGVTNITWPS